MSLNLESGVSTPFGDVTSTITGQARTILGPLTTTFTPPPHCTTAIVSDSLGFLAHTCRLPQGNLDDISCWPATSSDAATPPVPFQGWGFYSPGTICPTGYTSACSATGGAGGHSGWPVQFELFDPETAIGCCPSGYACGNAGGQTCIQTATSITVPTARCKDGDILETGVAAVPTTPEGGAPATLFAPMFQVNWQSSDRSALGVAPETSGTVSMEPSSTMSQSLVGTKTVSADSSPTGDLVMASNSGSPVTSPTPTTSVASGGAASNESDLGTQGNDHEETHETDGNGFPVAAMVGISIAGGLGALAVTIWAVYMWQRRRRWRKDMLQGIDDDRMLQLDNMYEEARPKTFDTVGRETVFGMNRQDTAGSRLDSDLMYGPGQETSTRVRAGPRRRPQIVGGFDESTTGNVGTSMGLGNPPSDMAHGPYYRL